MSISRHSIKIADIAQRVGVSSATVSRVLNNKGFVSEDMRARVMQAVDEANYQPRRVHKKTDGSQWVAVLTAKLINPFFAQILASIQEHTADQGLQVLVIQMPENADRRLQTFKALKQYPWTGLISAGCYMLPDEWARIHDELMIPMVVMNTNIIQPGITSLRVNFEGAMVKAIEHLLDLGHTRVAYWGDFSNEFSEAEFRGVEAALNRHGYSYPEEYRLSVSHTPEAASQGVNRMMMLPPESRPTALLTFDDEFAIHVLNALHYYSLRVPEDVSVVGFDNIPMSAHTTPPLTTIDIPKYRIGQQLVVLLQQLLENNGRELVGQMIVEGSLIVRDSTGPVPQLIQASVE